MKIGTGNRIGGIATLALAATLGMSSLALTACGGQPERTPEADEVAGTTDGEKAKKEDDGTATPSQKRGGLVTLKALCDSQDSKIAISRINGSWLGTLHDNGDDVAFVWVRDESNGAYYRVSFAGYDFAVVWDGPEDRGVVEFNKDIDNEYRRHIVLHLPEDELGSFDGETFDGTGDDEQLLQGGALDKIKESAAAGKADSDE